VPRLFEPNYFTVGGGGGKKREWRRRPPILAVNPAWVMRTEEKRKREEFTVLRRFFQSFSALDVRAMAGYWGEEKKKKGRGRKEDMKCSTAVLSLLVPRRQKPLKESEGEGKKGEKRRLSLQLLPQGRKPFSPFLPVLCSFKNREEGKEGEACEKNVFRPTQTHRQRVPTGKGEEKEEKGDVPTLLADPISGTAPSNSVKRRKEGGEEGKGLF